MKTGNTERAVEPRKRGSGLRPIEKDVIETFVRLAGLLHLPRSVGEIYGLLFLSPGPLPMDAIRDKLQLSKGGTSMGLKTLRSFGAVRVEYAMGDRREHYAAETELRKLAAGFLRDQLDPHLQSGKDRLDRMQDLLQDTAPEEQPFLRERIERLGHWQKRAERLVPLVMKIIRA
ncbi:MAG: hypothetical protein U1E27_08075 [Kiritimatiellia bacterium]|nr:hypothetical protein [Kiritimatiellia bacterium]